MDLDSHMLGFQPEFLGCVTGAVANKSLKVITVFHLWMLFFPAVLCPIFTAYERKERRREMLLTYQ